MAPNMPPPPSEALRWGWKASLPLREEDASFSLLELQTTVLLGAQGFREQGFSE